MMSMSGGMSAGSASSYFEREDYYLKGAENSAWIGTGAESLGLVGNIDKSDFSAIVAGINPGTGEQLVAGKPAAGGIEERRGGNDATFSAPKSVSVAFAAGVDGIKNAHDAAVLAVAQHIEQHYSHARTPDGLQNGSLVAAKFDHATSREGDPQLHSHLFVVNATQTADGQWRANEPKNLYVDQKLLGELYRAELANQLDRQGHEIRWTDRGSLQFELQNVPEAVIQEFSARREAIEAQVEQWKSDGKHANLSHAQLYERAALETRAAKNEMQPDQVKSQWQQGFANAGTTPEAVKSGIEQAQGQNLQQREQAQAQGRSAADVVQSAAQSLTATEATFTNADLLRSAVQISGSSHGLADIKSAVEQTTEKHGYDTKTGREIRTTTEMRELESRNVDALKTLASTEFKSVTTEQEVRDYLSKLEQTEGIRLSNGQQAHVINELAGTSALAVTQGDPGTGKTFASSIVERFNNEILKNSEREHFTINVAFTGKAAAEMSEASGKTAYTIDSFINAYNSGKIQITTPARAEQHQAASNNRSERVAGAAEQHHSTQAGRLREISSEHKNLAAGLKSQLHGRDIVGIGSSRNQDLLTPGRTSIAVNDRGFVLNYQHREQTGILKTDSRWSNKSVGIGQSARHSGSRNSNIFQTTTKQAGQYTENGKTIKYDETKTTNNLTTVKTSVRTERSENTVKRTESRTFGGKTSGVTTTINRDGSYSKTMWEGQKNWNGQFEITASRTEQGFNEKSAMREFSSAFVKTMVEAERIAGLAKQDISAAVTTVKNWFGLQKSSGAAEQKQEQTQTADKQATAVPAGSQIVIKIDEASFVGAKHAEQLLKITNEMRQQGHEVKILAVGDTKQLQNISAGQFFPQAQQIAEKAGNFAALKEINRQKNPELLKTAMTLNRDGDSRQLAQNGREAIQQLNEQNRISEYKTSADLKTATVERYMSESSKPSNNAEKAVAGVKQSTLIVTATNADRHELNNAIREARIDAGQIDRGEAVQTLQSVQRGNTADSYRTGDQISFNSNWGARQGTRAEVTGIDTARNTVQIHYTFNRGDQQYNVTKNFAADQLSQNTTAYEKRDREFSQGDRIMMLKNDTDLGVKNGQTGNVDKIENGIITATLDSGKTVEIDTQKYQNIDHGYASTVHKSQGATVESAILHHNPDAGAAATYNSLNVAATRATHELQVMTTDTGQLEQQAAGIDTKTTTVDQQQLHIQSSAEQQLSEKMDGLDSTQRAATEIEQSAAADKTIGATAEQNLAVAEAAGQQTNTAAEIESGATQQQQGQQENLREAVNSFVDQLSSDQQEHPQEHPQGGKSELSDAVESLKTEMQEQQQEQEQHQEQEKEAEQELDCE